MESCSRGDCQELGKYCLCQQQNWSEFFIENTPKIYRFLFALLGNTQDAEDCVQETFTRFFEHIVKFKPEYELLPWLIKMARHVAYNYYRKHKRARDAIPIEAATRRPLSGKSLEDTILDDIKIERFMSEIVYQVEISKAELEVLAILIDEDLKSGEIADILGQDPKKIYQVIWRLRTKLKKHFKRDDLLD